MTPKNVTIAQAAFHDDGANLIVEVYLMNGSDRTVHAVATARNLQYDPDTRTLQLLLSDRLNADHPGIFVRPRFLPVDPKAQTVLTVKLPRFLTRISPVANSASPTLEKLPIHEAAMVKVEIDWSDTPFYTDPRTSKTIRSQIVEWAKSTAKAEVKRRANDTPDT